MKPIVTFFWDRGSKYETNTRVETKIAENAAKVFWNIVKF
jgi:hypothetical protein